MAPAPRVSVFAIFAAMGAAVMVPVAGATIAKAAGVKPLNFTAIRNGDAWRRRIRAMGEAKLERAKAMALSTADALERKRVKDINKNESKAVKQHAEKQTRILNVTTAFFGRLFHWHRPAPAPTSPPCKYPLPGEKVFYIVQGAQSYDDTDGRLTPGAVASLEQLREDPHFARALGSGKQRAQVVIMGPMRKTLETAWKTFSEVLPDAKWEIDMDVRGARKEGLPILELGQDLVSQLNMSQGLREEYRAKVEVGDHGVVEDRWHRFIDRMRKRDDATHFVLVTHRYGCSETGIEIPEGGVRIAALVPDPPEEFGYVAYGGNAWRQLSQPSCWPDVDTPTANHTLVSASVVPEM